MNPKLLLHASRILRKNFLPKQKVRTTKTRCKHVKGITRKHKLHTILQYTSDHKPIEKQPPCNCNLVVYRCERRGSKRGNNIESEHWENKLGGETWRFEIGFAVSYALKGNKRGRRRNSRESSTHGCSIEKISKRVTSFPFNAFDLLFQGNR